MRNTSDRPQPKVLRMMTIIAISGLGAAACGGGGSSQGAAPDGKRESAVRIVKQELVQNADPNAVRFTDGEADCVARGTVELLGVARLQQMGMDLTAGTAPARTEPPLTTEEADSLYEMYGRCVDLKMKLATILGADGQLSQEQATCVAERYAASGLLRRSIFGAGSDPALNEEIDQEMGAATAACT